MNTMSDRKLVGNLHFSERSSAKNAVSDYQPSMRRINMESTNLNYLFKKVQEEGQPNSYMESPGAVKKSSKPGTIDKEHKIAHNYKQHNYRSESVAKKSGVDGRAKEVLGFQATSSFLNSKMKDIDLRSSNASKFSDRLERKREQWRKEKHLREATVTMQPDMQIQSYPKDPLQLHKSIYSDAPRFNRENKSLKSGYKDIQKELQNDRDVKGKTKRHSTINLFIKNDSENISERISHSPVLRNRINHLQKNTENVQENPKDNPKSTVNKSFNGENISKLNGLKNINLSENTDYNVKEINENIGNSRVAIQHGMNYSKDSKKREGEENDGKISRYRNTERTLKNNAAQRRMNIVNRYHKDRDSFNQFSIDDGYSSGTARTSLLGDSNNGSITNGFIDNNDILKMTTENVHLASVNNQSISLQKHSKERGFYVEELKDEEDNRSDIHTKLDNILKDTINGRRRHKKPSVQEFIAIDRIVQPNTHTANDQMVFRHNGIPQAPPINQELLTPRRYSEYYTYNTPSTRSAYSTMQLTAEDKEELAKRETLLNEIKKVVLSRSMENLTNISPMVESNSPNKLLANVNYIDYDYTPPQRTSEITNETETNDDYQSLNPKLDSISTYHIPEKTIASDAKPTELVTQNLFSNISKSNLRSEQQKAVSTSNQKASLGSKSGLQMNISMFSAFDSKNTLKYSDRDNNEIVTNNKALETQNTDSEIFRQQQDTSNLIAYNGVRLFSNKNSFADETNTPRKFSLTDSEIELGRQSLLGTTNRTLQSKNDDLAQRNSRNETDTGSDVSEAIFDSMQVVSGAELKKPQNSISKNNASFRSIINSEMNVTLKSKPRIIGALKSPAIERNKLKEENYFRTKSSSQIDNMIPVVKGFDIQKEQRKNTKINAADESQDLGRNDAKWKNEFQVTANVGKLNIPSSFESLQVKESNLPAKTKSPVTSPSSKPVTPHKISKKIKQLFSPKHKRKGKNLFNEEADITRRKNINKTGTFGFDNDESLLNQSEDDIDEDFISNDEWLGMSNSWAEKSWKENMYDAGSLRSKDSVEKFVKKQPKIRKTLAPTNDFTRSSMKTYQRTGVGKVVLPEAFVAQNSKYLGRKYNGEDLMDYQQYGIVLNSIDVNKKEYSKYTNDYS